MLRHASLVLAFALPAVAQATYVVGVGGYPDVDAALVPALPGDEIVVDAGNYAGFTLSKGVTVRAAVPGTVVFGGGVFINCPPPQVAHVIGIRTENGTFVNDATCSFDDCSFRQPTLQGPALACEASRLNIQDCEVGSIGAPYIGFGTSPGLRITDSVVSAVDSSFQGWSRDTQFGVPGSAGIEMSNGELQGSHLTVRGGSGLANGSGAPGPGIPPFFGPPGTVWLTDSTVIGGEATDLPGSPENGCPLSAAAGRTTRTTLIGGLCAPGIPTDGPGVGLRRTAPFVSGASYTLEVHCDPTHFVGLWAALDVGGVLFPGVLEQSVLLDLATAIPFSVLLTDAAGTASATYALPPGVTGLTLWFQAVREGPLPITLSPAVGGVIR